MIFTEVAYSKVAQELDCEIALIKAIEEVESAQAGFTKEGRLMCLFEGHVFHNLTKGKFDKNYPTISYRKWTKKHYYSDPDKEYKERFSLAFLLDKDAAMQSASWGAFQIMGFHYQSLGFKTVDEMHLFLKADIDNHLLLFARFVKGNSRLLLALQQKNFQKIAYYYNGAGYRKNKYDQKIEAAYKANLPKAFV